MTDPQRKLTVRVKLAPEPGPEVTAPPQYAYRWDRIALVGLALVVVVVLVFRLLLTPDPAPAESAGTADQGGRTIAASTPAPGPEPEPEPAERAGEPAPAIPEPGPEGPAAPEEPLPAVRQDTAVAAAPTAAPPAEPRFAEPPSTQPPAEQPPAAQPATAIAGTAGPSADGSEDAAGVEGPAPAAASARSGVLAGGATRILSDSVTRFVLTDEVRDLEPVGGVSDIRARPPGGPVAVFAFSDVRGLGGETLYYRWIRDEKVAANVKVRVGSNRWRSYSSKFINDNMRGPWRVELRNSAGDLLAHAEFEY